MNLSKLPTRLVCQECVHRAEQMKRSPFNVLLWPHSKHSKLSKEDLVSEFLKWLPGFIIKEMEPTISVNIIAYNNRRCAACKKVSSKCMCSAPSKSSSVDPEAEIPAINSSTGETVVVEEEDIIKEPSDETFYIMQMLDLRGEETLTFFDRGANWHLIDGDLAETINLKVLNPKSVPVSVVGGGRIWTEHGMYGLMLGPNVEGKFFELQCQGIKKITQEFPKYDLRELTKEIQKSKQIGPTAPLPQYIMDLM